ncbi:MAG: extracellular solute-binding protein [Oscillospiraceae bacterium]|nr:extracellular solute-binding protein [Oscillospiraceae bacterium]
MAAVKNTATRLMAAVLAVALLFTLTSGCKNDIGDNNGDTESPVAAFNVSDDTEGYVYVPQELSLPDGISDIQDVIYIDGRLYFVSNHHDSGSGTFLAEYTSSSKICAINIDGTGFEELSGYIPPVQMPEDAFGGVLITAMSADDEGNLWVLEHWEFFRYELPAGFDAASPNAGDYGIISLDFGSALRKLDKTGSYLSSIDIGGIFEEQQGFAPRGFAIGGDGNIYLFASFTDIMATFVYGEVIYVMGSDGNMLYDIIPYFPRSADIVRMANGNVAYLSTDAYGDGTGTYGLRVVEREEDSDGDTEDFSGDVTEVPSETLSMLAYPGSGGFDAFLCTIGSLYGIMAAAGEHIKLLDWLGSNINTGAERAESVVVLPDGRIICNLRSYAAAGGAQTSRLLILTKTPISEISEKTVLTLAGVFISDAVIDRVAWFNGTNADYHIEVTDYAYVSGNYYDYGGIDRLVTDIITGNIPDILYMVRLPYDRYAANGLLEDLYPFIDSDPELSRADLVTGVFKAAETDGKLYRIFPDFEINTLAGHPSVLGSDTNWTINDLKAIIDAHPDADMPLGQSYPRYDTTPGSMISFLLRMIAYNIEEFINWGEGKVMFNTDTFIEMLEFVDEYLTDDERLTIYQQEPFNEFNNPFATGHQLVQDVKMPLYIGTYVNLKFQLGGEIVFKGFPTGSGSRHGFTAYQSIGITTVSKNKAGAWQFLRSLLDADFQISQLSFYNFPSNKAAFDELLIRCMDESSDVIPRHPVTRELLAPTITQEDADKIIALVNSLTPTSDDWLLYGAFADIISESAEDFFNGRNTAREAAEIIQSRVSIYVWEHG